MGEGINSDAIYSGACTYKVHWFMYDGSYGEEGVTGQVILTNNDLLGERIACRNP